MGFQTANSIKIQPYEDNYDVAFKFPIATSSSSNDGTLPFGTTIFNADVTAWYGDTEATDLLSDTPVINGDDTIIVSFKYPTTTMDGITKIVNMTLRFILTLDNDTVIQEYFKNIQVGDQK